MSDLTQIVRHSADAAASRAEQAGLDFSLEVPDERILVAAPESLVRTAVENLLDNALKFTSVGQVLLAANVEAAVAVVVVEDSGIGIPAEDVDSLFERFHRGRNAAAYPGSGLGLAIVKATAKAYGGTVGIGSGPHGTRVELRLPLAEAPGA